MRTEGKHGEYPLELVVLAFAREFHTTPWEVEENMTGKWWGWWQEELRQRQNNRGRPKD